MKDLMKALTSAAVSAVTVATLSACGAVPDTITYELAAYGVPGHCYYVDSAAEVTALQAADLCPRSWVATLMPLAWHEEYWDYYDSPAYYDTYVPARTRTVYVKQQTTFGHSYSTAIKTRSKLATYRSSSGTLVKGTKVTGKTKFGSGKSFGSAGQKYGGGSLRSGGSSKSSSSGSTGRSSGGSPGSSSSKSRSSSRGGSLRSGSRSHR